MSEEKSNFVSEAGFAEKLFHLKENKTTVRTEIIAGVTTFLAMAYILAVNPSILSASGMDRGGVMIATALAAFVGTTLMSLFANYPFALAPGMGLNAYFAYTVVLKMGYSWQFAMLAVFVEGLIFLALSLTKVREAIFNCIPMSLKTAISVGIGLFIALIAMQNAHIIVDNPATLLSLQTFNHENIGNHGMCAILAIVGTIITGIMMSHKIKGSILLGIFITWGLGMIAQAIGLYNVVPELGCYSLYPNFSLNSLQQTFTGFSNIFCGFFDASSWTLRDSEITGFALVRTFNFVVIMFAFMFVDIFDTMGTLVGVATKANFLDKDGKLPKIKGALLADSFATSIGAVFGTSTTTTFVESASGVAEGGRTGLTALVTALLFLASIIFAPIFLAIPGFATAPALIIVGFFMLTGIKNLNMDEYMDAIPAYVAIIVMPFAYSISEGIAMGVITWTVMNFFSSRRSKINPLMYVLTVLFLAKYVML